MVTILEIEVDTSVLAELAEKAVNIRQALSMALDDFMQALESTAKDYAPIVTGNLRASHTVYPTGELERVLTVDTNQAPYAIFVHEGTSPYVIEIKNARALAFDGIVTKRVHHPGIRPNPWLRDAMDSVNAVEHIESFLEMLLG